MQSRAASNFHTHTHLCKHAEGTVADYVSAAASDGCSALGFSDHCPYPDDGRDTWPGVRMSPAEAASYTEQVREAAKDSPFPVYLGLECEYDRRYLDWYKHLKESLSLDYLALGPHWVDVRGEFVYAPQLEGEKDIRRYFDGIVEGIGTGLFGFVAHPDLIMADGRAWTRELEAGFNAVIEASVQAGIPLEINGEGLSRPLVASAEGPRHPYPVDRFWELARSRGATVICNSDAHKPRNVVLNALRAREYAASLGITPLEGLFRE